MIQNEGELDRILRVFLGSFFFMIAYTMTPGIGRWLLTILAILLVLSGFTGYSSFYHKMGISTLLRKRTSSIR